MRWGVRPRVLNGSKNRAPATAEAADSAQHANSPRITQLPSRADRRRLSDGLFTLLNLACMSAAALGQPPPPHSRTPTLTRARARADTHARSPSTVHDNAPLQRGTFSTIYIVHFFFRRRVRLNFYFLTPFFGFVARTLFVFSFPPNTSYSNLKNNIIHYIETTWFCGGSLRARLPRFFVL